MLNDVKDYLNITWDHEDVKISKMIERGESKLNTLTGVELDFSAEGEPKSLLLDYCRYAYNNALEYFESNFSDEILNLQFIEAVKVNDSKQS